MIGAFVKNICKYFTYDNSFSKKMDSTYLYSNSTCTHIDMFIVLI